jgi:poly-beta-hydroxyalkanoate depolymerase
VVPQLKRLAPTAHFIGPVNYHYDRAYLSTFLSSARPRPDEISWHEYTCNDNQTTDVCIAHIANWTGDFADARATMRSILGTALPIMITEWNYTSKVDPNDGKHHDSAFLSTWTTRALQTLAANRIFASMQYACTDTIPMIKNAALTAQGATFQQQYEQMIMGGQIPAPVSSTT